MSDKEKSDKTPASLREFNLLVTDHKGIPLTPEVMLEVKEENEAVEALSSPDDRLDEALLFRSQKRGKVYDHLKMAISIMEMPKGDKGVSRKEGQTIESLLDKLYEAEESDDRPGSVLLDEGEWKHLRDRVADHNFPNHGRATRRFQGNVIDETEKVPVAKVGDKKADKPEE